MAAVVRPRTWLVAGAVGAGLGVLHARSRGRRPVHLERIARLDPDADHQQIAAITATWEFPWDTETALSLALFRTYAVPTISRILADTDEFTGRTRKRYDDTELLLSEVQEHGYDSARGTEATRRINRMHAAYPIRPIDMTYVLSTFVAEPDRWNERFGWRAASPAERAAAWRYWRELGARMGVRDLPDTMEEFLAWNARFEAAEFRYDPANHAVADATMRMYLGEVYGVPDRLLPLAIPATLALLDEPLIRALGYDVPPAWLRRAVPALLRARAWVLRNLVPPRRTPVLLTERDRPTYPLGYAIADLGTFPDRDRAAKAGIRDGVLPRDVPAALSPPRS